MTFFPHEIHVTKDTRQRLPTANPGARGSLESSETSGKSPYTVRARNCNILQRESSIDEREYEAWRRQSGAEGGSRRAACYDGAAERTQRASF